MAKSIAVAQAKPATPAQPKLPAAAGGAHGAAGGAHRAPAAHVAAATLRTGAQIQPKAAPHPLQQGPPRPAPHLAAALARVPPGAGAALPKSALPTAGRPTAAHVAAAALPPRALQAKSAAPHPRAPAAHVAAAAQRAKAAPPPAPPDGVLQRAKAAWAKRKQNYIDETTAANTDIKKLSGTTTNYFDLFPDVPADVKVSIHGLTPSGPLNLDRDASQMVNFSYSLKELKKVDPELQTALIRNTTSSSIDKIRISANTSKINDGLRKITGKHNLGKFYRQEVRPYHVKKRRLTLEREASKVGKTDLRDLLEEVRKEKKGLKRADFDKGVNQKLGKLLHTRTRKLEERQRMKSARGFAFDPRFTALPIHIPANTSNIHAESAIEAETEGQPNEKIDKVYGTKVPCLACQAFFQGKGQRALLMDHSSFAWLSESSLKQLGFKKDQIKAYLLHIRTTLGTLGINEYGVSSGEISITDLTVDADPTSDSEDEEARNAFDYAQVGGSKKKKSKKDIEFQMEIDTFGAKHFK